MNEINFLDNETYIKMLADYLYFLVDMIVEVTLQ